MNGYYQDKLSAENLRRVYDVAQPRVIQYLESETEFVLNHINASDIVLEMGCGYGRVLDRIAKKAAFAVGIDTSFASLQLARKSQRPQTGHCLMDAVRTGFVDNCFDVAVCIQNGISAFHVDQRNLIEEALRITRPGGTVLFSSYSQNFWDDRLEWFELQAKHGLLGEIDYDATGDGVIVCKDGFRATTVSSEEFISLTDGLGGSTKIVEVDNSSLFCIITIP